MNQHPALLTRHTFEDGTTQLHVQLEPYTVVLSEGMLLLHKDPYPDLLSLDVGSDTVATLLRWAAAGRLGAQAVADDLQFWDITQPDRYFHIPLWADDLATASGWEDRDQESEN